MSELRPRPLMTDAVTTVFNANQRSLPAGTLAKVGDISTATFQSFRRQAVLQRKSPIQFSNIGADTFLLIFNPVSMLARERESPMTQEHPMMVGAATVFVVSNITKSIEHYRDALGFTVTFQYGNPTFYACLCRDEVALHLLAAHETKRLPGNGGICVFVKDVDLVYVDLVSRGAK